MYASVSVFESKSDRKCKNKYNISDICIRSVYVPTIESKLNYKKLVEQKKNGSTDSGSPTHALW